MSINVRLAVSAVLCSSVIGYGASVEAQQEQDPRASQRIEGQRDVSEGVAHLGSAIDVYRNVAQGDKQVPSSVRNEARCIAVIPNTRTAALGIGGTHGDGVAACKTPDGDWSNPVFINATGGSLGVQAGMKTADLVLYMTGENAQNALQKGKFELGGEMGVVAGSFDEGFDVPKSGVVAYSISKGAFAGVSVSGLNISIDKEEMRDFYGQSYTEADVFDSQVPAAGEEVVERFQNMLPA
ncbi:MAG: lipid-binding SYLF domain-containing protein [Deltaproteobacteria bacterium]|nr:lipid-binding SYLF domain-containing protein [Deltaproteobacteria bacterium]